MKIEKFPQDKNLCFVSVLSEYLERTEHLRNSQKLLISTIKPHQAVSKDTVARWIRQTMNKAAINNMFKAAYSVTFDLLILKLFFLFFKNTVKILKFR